MKEKTIKKDLKEKYEERLKKQVKINGQTTTFWEQYENAPGHELESKFWSKISSSRLCFELYSWIAEQDKCLDFSFEYPLPGIRSGNDTTKSYMDVYIKTDNGVWFIESKFTEEPDKTVLSGAYYQSFDKNDNGVLTEVSDFKKPTYYTIADGISLCANPKSLSDRFSGRDDIIQPFVEFVRYALDLKKGNTSDWFDVKQEICHLLGIIMYITNEENLKEIEGKTINFRNIVYNKKGTEYYIREDTLANLFIAKAQETVNEIIKLYGLNVKFTYAASSVQDLISKYGDATSYCNEGKTVKETIRENFEGEIKL